MIKKMKRNLTGVLLTALMMGACNHAPQEGTYHLRGMVTNPKLEGRTIYLKDAVKNAAVGTLRYRSEGTRLNSSHSSQSRMPSSA